jgi:DNA-binding IclR family transcriptional regulator
MLISHSKTTAVKTNASILKGASILRALCEGRTQLRDIAATLKLNKSTVYRLLQSLIESSLVVQDPISRQYYLGPLVLNLSSQPILTHQRLIVTAFNEMKALRDLTKETVNLHVRIGLERICLEEIQSIENIRYTPGKGFAAPLYTGSSGKMLLSQLPDHELDLLLGKLTLVRIAPNTITDRRTLKREVLRARQRGYAISIGERVAASASISVAIAGYGTPVAMSVLGPEYRFTRKVMTDLLGEISGAAGRIGRALLAPGRVPLDARSTRQPAALPGNGPAAGRYPVRRAPRPGGRPAACDPKAGDGR